MNTEDRALCLQMAIDVGTSLIRIGVPSNAEQVIKDATVFAEFLEGPPPAVLVTSGVIGEPAAINPINPDRLVAAGWNNMAPSWLMPPEDMIDAGVSFLLDRHISKFQRSTNQELRDLVTELTFVLANADRGAAVFRK
jgi:hypothetical protein